jgi:hypothetical protein
MVRVEGKSALRMSQFGLSVCVRKDGDRQVGGGEEDSFLEWKTAP